MTDRYVYERVDVIVPFDRVSDAYRLIDPPSVLLAGEDYADINTFHFDVRASLRGQFAARLTELRLATPR